MDFRKGEEHLIERLTVGETYTLREEFAPYGYLIAEEVTFYCGRYSGNSKSGNER